MARLNEPPVLGDSIEALKRRFIRQNREIARANSVQSTKIRTLEVEASRLLSENITLREENIRLQKALDESRRQGGAKDISLFKAKFDTKVQELNELIAELSKPAEAKGLTPSPNRAQWRSHRQSLYQRPRPSPEELVEIAIAEGRLAPIIEDNRSPSKSFYVDEIRISIPDLSNITDSPELALAPAMHVEHSDPVKRPGPMEQLDVESPSRAATTAPASQDDPSLLSANLETRRRRRESATTNTADVGKPHESNTNMSSLSKATESGATSVTKTGAKRKLGARDEEPKTVTKSVSQQDLNSNRRREFEEPSSLVLSRSKSHVNLSSIASSMNKNRSRPANLQQSRRALGEKSVNTDPIVSPAKPKQSEHDKSSDQLKKDGPLIDPSLPERKEKSTIRQIRPIKLPEESIKTAEIRVPPKTPAPLDDDVFSPESRPSTGRVESRDTPPPGDLQSGGDNANRPSRRPRNAVSYAEPNLRDKMRRPGKELVDAVSGVQRQSMSASELPPKDTDLRLSIINNGAHSLKTKEATSPLTGKSSSRGTLTSFDSSALPNNVVADRRRRSAALGNGSESRTTSASQETIAALISSSNKRLSRVKTPAFEPSTKGLSSLTESLSVFDLHLSSPPSSSLAGCDESEGVAKVEDRPKASNRMPKRHSSVSDSLKGVNKDREKEEPRKRGLEEMEREDERAVEGSRRAERAERRRSMMV